MKERFKLSHLVLYAKGWYAKTDDVWEDLQKILRLDNYTPFHKNDVYSIIVGNVQEYGQRWTELREIMFGIHPHECWKYGYYTEESKHWAHKDAKIAEYDMPTAFIYYVLSNLRQLDNKKWNVVTPKYKLHPKPKSIATQQVIEMFNKK